MQDIKAKEQEILLPTARISSSPQQIVAPIGDRSSSTSDSKARQAIRHIIAGGFAGLTEICLMHPLDVIKTRFQIQGGPSNAILYKSYVDCVQTMARTEGALSFYKGIVPPLFAETPKRAMKFFTFEQYKSLLATNDGEIIGIRLVLAGTAAGLTEGLFITPFERVKVSLQAQRAHSSISPSTWSHARTIIKQDGLGVNGGLFGGLGATLWRHGVWNAVYFGFYHNLKPLVFKDEKPSVPSRLFLGFLAGSLASVSNIPFDVAKSRIQGRVDPKKYRSTLQTVAVVAKEEGFIALYKGLLPKIMRLGPGGGIMFVVFEQVSAFLKSKGL